MLRRIKPGFVCVFVCMHVCVFVCNCFQLCLCVCMHYWCILLTVQGFSPGSLIFWPESQRGPPISYRAESYVSETLTLFQAIIFPFFLSFWLSYPSFLLALTSSCPSFLSNQCSFQLLSSHNIFVFFPPLPAICCTSLAGCVFFALSSLFSLSPHSLLQMSDQTEQHDSQRRAEFPLVHHSISNVTVCCVQNLKLLLETWNTDTD